MQTKYFRQNHKYVDIIKKYIFTKNTKEWTRNLQMRDSNKHTYLLHRLSTMCTDVALYVKCSI